jgi:hypothetical protein
LRTVERALELARQEHTLLQAGPQINIIAEAFFQAVVQQARERSLDETPVRCRWAVTGEVAFTNLSESMEKATVKIVGASVGFPLIVLGTTCFEDTIHIAPEHSF